MMRNKTFFIVVLAAMLLVTACADTAIDRHMLESRVRRAWFLIPYTRSDLAAAMHSEGKVLSTE